MIRFNEEMAKDHTTIDRMTSTQNKKLAMHVKLFPQHPHVTHWKQLWVNDRKLSKIEKDVSITKEKCGGNYIGSDVPCRQNECTSNQHQNKANATRDAEGAELCAQLL